jgi:hypothetical protein
MSIVEESMERSTRAVILRPRSKRAEGTISTCQDCGDTLNDSNWSPSMRSRYRKRYTCSSCWSKRQRAYYDKYDSSVLARRNHQAKLKQSAWTPERREKERRRAYGNRIRKLYGMSLLQYDIILKSQDGKCAICFRADPTGKGSFHVDHCHQTGEVRGLLCSRCNMMIGMASDSIEVLLRAVSYLGNATRIDHTHEHRKTAEGKKY